MISVEGEGVQIVSATNVSEFTHRILSGSIDYTRVLNSNTMKFYARYRFNGNNVYFMNIFTGQTKKFTAKLDGYDLPECLITHKRDVTPHPQIKRLEFEQLIGYNFGVVLFVICGEGVYLSTACLNKKDNSLEINPANKIGLSNNSPEIQLLILTEDIGLAIYGRYEYPNSIMEFIKFQVSKNYKSPIEIVGNNHIYASFHYVIPYIHNGHAYFFAKFDVYYQLVDFDYVNCTFEIDENKPIPHIKCDMIGVWNDDKFYFLYQHHQAELSSNWYYEFGVFCLQTKRFSPVKLPQNIPDEWMYWIKLSTSLFNPFLMIDERSVLTLMPVKIPKLGCSFPQDCHIEVFRIPLRVPETLLNLSYFSFLKKRSSFKQSFQEFVNEIYSNRTDLVQ